jgi:hypothetical protein
MYDQLQRITPYTCEKPVQLQRINPCTCKKPVQLQRFTPCTCEQPVQLSGCEVCSFVPHVVVGVLRFVRGWCRRSGDLHHKCETHARICMGLAYAWVIYVAACPALCCEELGLLSSDLQKAVQQSGPASFGENRWCFSRPRLEPGSCPPRI